MQYRRLTILAAIVFSHFQIAWATEPTAEQIEALSLKPNIENGRKVYHNCAICHGAEAWGTLTGHYPQLAGQHPNVIIKQLADIRAGNRDNPTMLPFASQEAMGGAQCMTDIAAYLSQLPMNPNNEVGFGRDLEYGKKIYQEHCVKCHGENGEGNNGEFYPRLQGQSYHYLLRQMRWIQLGKRRNANKTMVQQIHNFTGRDITAVVDYASRLKADAAKLAQPNWRNPDFSPDFKSAVRFHNENYQLNQK